MLMRVQQQHVFVGLRLNRTVKKNSLFTDESQFEHVTGGGEETLMKQRQKR